MSRKAKNTKKSVYSSARIFDDFPNIGPSQSTAYYYDAILDNLEALRHSLNKYTKTSQEKALIVKIMKDLSKLKDAVISIDEIENRENTDIEINM